MKKDIIWLDYTRALGMFLVVFGHLWQRIPAFGINEGFKGIWNYIYLFHMPLFFVISGFLFKSENAKTINKITAGGGKIFYSLVAPYLIYQMLYLVWLVVRKPQIMDAATSMKMLLGIVMGDGYDTPVSMVVCLPCWFIISIIQLRVLFMLVPINKHTASILTAISVVGLLLLKHRNVDLYFCIDSTLMAIPYFLLGYYISKKDISSYSHGTLIFTGIVSALYLAFVLVVNGPAQMIGPSYGRNIFLNYSAGIVGTMFIVSISMLLAKHFGENANIRVVSRNTLFIIFFHWVLLIPFGAFIKRCVSILGDNLIVMFITTSILTLCILAISKYAINLGTYRFPLLFGKYKR